jgi:hypothetical protein
MTATFVSTTFVITRLATAEPAVLFGSCGLTERIAEELPRPVIDPTKEVDFEWQEARITPVDLAEEQLHIIRADFSLRDSALQTKKEMLAVAFDYYLKVSAFRGLQNGIRRPAWARGCKWISGCSRITVEPSST